MRYHRMGVHNGVCDGCGRGEGGRAKVNFARVLVEREATTQKVFQNSYITCTWYTEKVLQKKEFGDCAYKLIYVLVARSCP